jgi:hypothetical protein
MTFIQAGPKAWLSAAILTLGIVGVIYFKTGAETAPTATRAESDPAQPRRAPTNQIKADKPVDLKEQIMNDARKTARTNYVDFMRETFRNGGVDASISDINGKLVMVSDVLKEKPDRDRILRGQFGPAVRRDLCKMGFKTLALKSGVLLGDGDEYSLGCPERKEEKEARLQEQREARQKFVDDLQRTFNTDQQGQGMQVTQENNEIVLTADLGDLSPQMIRAMWVSKFSDQEKKNLCGIGLRGLRARADVNSPGTLVSFGCTK